MCVSTQSGFLSGMPYLVLWMTQMTSGIIADFLRGRGYLSTATTRKMMNTVGELIAHSGDNGRGGGGVEEWGGGGGEGRRSGVSRTMNIIDVVPQREL